MKQAVLLSAMGVMASFATVAGAEELGRVVSSTPVIQQVAVPRQVCSQWRCNSPARAAEP
jgi:uncharacterized protein YcfJ